MSRGFVRVVSIGAVGLAVWSVAALAAFRYPRVDPPTETDAYYVLASPGGVEALTNWPELLPANKPLLLSVTAEQFQLPASGDLYREWCARSDREVICVDPDPATTQGEAQNLGRFAAQHGWRSVTVITHRSHITRSRILMERCFDGEIRMTAVDAERGRRVWLRALIYETGAMAKTLVTPRC